MLPETQRAVAQRGDGSTLGERALVEARDAVVRTARRVASLGGRRREMAGRGAHFFCRLASHGDGDEGGLQSLGHRREAG